MHDAVARFTRTSLRTQLGTKLLNQLISTVVKHVLKFPHCLLQAMLAVAGHRARLEKKDLFLEQGESFVEGVSMVVELGDRITQIGTQAKDSTEDVAWCKDEFNGEGDYQNG